MKLLQFLKLVRKAKKQIDASVAICKKEEESKFKEVIGDLNKLTVELSADLPGVDSPRVEGVEEDEENLKFTKEAIKNAHEIRAIVRVGRKDADGKITHNLTEFGMAELLMIANLIEQVISLIRMIREGRKKPS